MLFITLIFCFVSLRYLLVIFNWLILRFRSSIIFPNELLESFLAIVTVVKAGDLKTIKSSPLTLTSKSVLSSVDDCRKNIWSSG